MYQEIQDSLSRLASLVEMRENRLIENEGEVTPDIEAIEAEIDFINSFLQGDGIDALGRWLTSKEDEVKRWKAEKAAADRRVKSAQNSVDFVKGKIAEVMVATGMDKAKGSFYSFTKYVSEKSSVNQEELDRAYLDMVTEAARKAGLPDYVDVQLKTTTSALKEAFAYDLLDITTNDAVRFTKPRAGKE